ncbi:sugar transferase [Flavobacterium paronense]|uniref:Sugar transferase n=1 Tax=Flavobacterium paronense TaxID=1392775 RepID=A0ABV5GAN5_9FLAO|nr:sugar transferase [Flavobacterium paronense]MDN3676692.1 sugar transferase [Flavobacterium paronense]
MYRNYTKRIFDIFFSIFGIIVLSPIFLIVTLLLFFTNRGLPFFLQNRSGKHGKIFKIIKFKTMNNNRNSDGELLPDELRVTKIGMFIRRISLDEIPQLINVLNGDMSIVGPRPLLSDYFHLFTDFQNRRHEVKPGITGWVQVNGRNALSWKKKFEYDVWYVDHVSLLLDLKIIFKTVLKVFKSDDITSADSASIEPFQGFNIKY